MSFKQSVLAIIPARAGSKRLPGKNKKLLNGKELIRYAIETCLASREITAIAVTSDDEDILTIANQYHGLHVFIRPESIAGDNAPAITYVRDVLQKIGGSFDLIAIVQATSPFTLSDDIDHTIRLLRDNDEADSAVSVMRLDHAIHPVKLKVMEGNVLKSYLEEENGRMAAHELPELYVRNCSVYVCRIENIAKDYIIGGNCLGYVMPRERSLDINDAIDFEFAEFLMNKRSHQ